eukprot:snap_masked-scaffold_7-processed-gene-8.43-mRNA-1 protein AED:1.00 eAED:1.00 QI:0/-1/0/0/-1/1/1/0/263
MSAETEKLIATLKSSMTSPDGFKTNYVLVNKSIISLPYVYTKPPPKSLQAAVKNRSLALSAYELAIQFYSSQSDLPNLKSSFALARNFYFDPLLKEKLSGSKTKKTEFVALELLTLLVEQKFGEFYFLVEKLSSTERSDTKLSAVIEYEKCLMEGNYTELLKRIAEKKKKGEGIEKELMKQLEETAKKEIASCFSSAYSEIEEKKVEKLVGKDSKVTEGWLKVSGKYRFDNGELERKVKFEKSEKEGIIKDGLKFAADLERII